MSDAVLNSSALKVRGFVSGRMFNGAGSAGPRRLMILTVAALAVLALIVIVAATGRKAPSNSRDARMKHVDPLPGGLYSTPEQDKLAHEADNAQAQSSLENGVSFTPPMAPSAPLLPAPPQVEKAAPPDGAQLRPVFAGRPAPPKPVPSRSPFRQRWHRTRRRGHRRNRSRRPSALRQRATPKAMRRIPSRLAICSRNGADGHRAPTSCCRPPRRTVSGPPAMVAKAGRRREQRRARGQCPRRPLRLTPSRS